MSPLSVGLLGFLPLVSLLDYSLVYWYVTSFGRNIRVQQYRIGHGGAEAAHAVSEAAAKNLTPLTLVVSIMLHVNLPNNY